MRRIKVGGKECEESRACFEGLDWVCLGGSCTSFLFFDPVHGFGASEGIGGMWETCM